MSMYWWTDWPSHEVDPITQIDMLREDAQIFAGQLGGTTLEMLTRLLDSSDPAKDGPLMALQRKAIDLELLALSLDDAS